jgi:hypothetical protein
MVDVNQTLMFRDQIRVDVNHIPADVNQILVTRASSARLWSCLVGQDQDLVHADQDSLM